MGKVGVGTATAKEVIDAVQKAVTDAKKHLIQVRTAHSPVPLLCVLLLVSMTLLPVNKVKKSLLHGAAAT